MENTNDDDQLVGDYNEDADQFDEADMAYVESDENNGDEEQDQGADKQQGQEADASGQQQQQQEQEQGQEQEQAEGAQDADDEIAQLQAQVQSQESSLQQDREALNAVLKNGSQESREEADRRSVFVQNVDYSASETDLQAFFGACGPVRRITIGRLPTGKPKGYAYVEFTDEKAVDAAKALSNQMLKGRQVTVLQKRTNIPGLRKRGRGRGRGRGRFHGYRGRRGRARARGHAVYFSTQ